MGLGPTLVCGGDAMTDLSEQLRAAHAEIQSLKRALNEACDMIGDLRWKQHVDRQRIKCLENEALELKRHLPIRMQIAGTVR